MKKITAPTGRTVHGAHQLDQPDTPWWVDGVLYTDAPGHIAYFTRRGYPIEDAPDGAPTDYIERVEAMRTQGERRSTSFAHDALAPDHRNYAHI